jgi:hypothetical protein
VLRKRKKQRENDWESQHDLTGRVNTDLSFDDALGVLFTKDVLTTEPFGGATGSPTGADELSQ